MEWWACLYIAEGTFKQNYAFIGNELEIDGFAYELTECGSEISFEAITNLVLDTYVDLKMWEKLQEPQVNFIGISHKTGPDGPVTNIIMSELDIERRKSAIWSNNHVL